MAENVEIQEVETIEKKGIVGKAKDAGKNLMGVIRKNWKPFAVGVGSTLAAGLAAGSLGAKADGDVSNGIPQTDFDSPSETIDVPFEEVTIE